MTHFETKPISASRLAAAIARVLELAALPQDGPQDGPREAAPPVPVAARVPTGFDASRLAALVEEIGPGPVAEAVRQFQADALRQMEDMRDLAQAGRMDLLGHQARLVARAARAVGLVQLGLAAAAIQEEVAAGRYEGLRERVEALEPLVLTGLDALRRWPVPAAPADRAGG
jgi:HPt (histidine-containing phosphotransfer) domain-containing protein